jgi:hypothetical protein
MAIELVERRVCDMHTTTVDATHTVTFQWEGKAYELDVCERHAESVRTRFRGLLDKAREATQETPARRTRVRVGEADKGASPTALRAKQKARRDKIRAWATENGYPVPSRGRIPAETEAAYKSANRRVAAEPSRAGES